MPSATISVGARLVGSSKGWWLETFLLVLKANLGHQHVKKLSVAMMCVGHTWNLGHSLALSKVGCITCMSCYLFSMSECGIM